MNTIRMGTFPDILPGLYAVRLSDGAVEIVQLERGAPPTYVESVRHGLVREARHATAGAAFAAAKHLAGWNRKGIDGADRVMEIERGGFVLADRGGILFLLESSDAPPS